MLFAGFNVSRATTRLFAAPCSWPSAANVVGSWIAYAVGYYGRIELLERHGSKLHIKPSHLERGRPLVRALRRAPTVFFARMLPIVRTFISLPAGVARMPFWRFTAAHASLGCIPWMLLLDVHRQAGGRQLGATGRTSCTTSTTRSSR